MRNTLKIGYVLIVLSVAADLTQVFGNSYVINILHWLLGDALPFLVFLFVATLIGIAYYYRDKYKNLQSDLRSMVRTARDMLNSRFKGTHVVYDRFMCKCKILNSEGDCEFNISEKIRASSDTPITQLEVYTSDEKGGSTFEDFCASLTCDGANAIPLEHVRIEGENFFIYRLEFPRAIDKNNPHEYRTRYCIKKYFPLDHKDNKASCHVAVPTKWTGCSIELPTGWKIASRRAVCDEPGGQKQLLTDSYFHEIDGEGFQWYIENPKTHAFYDVYFTANKL